MVVWQLDNLKCGGCVKRIRRSLSVFEGLDIQEIDPETGLFSFELQDASLLSSIEQRLKTLGYPKHGELTGMSATSAQVRSVVSCLIGRLSDDVSE